MNKTYTIEQIKKAYWLSFHKSGELWFNYLGDEESNQSSTEEYWQEFEENLVLGECKHEHWSADGWGGKTCTECGMYIISCDIG
jgi:hypothetical protein